MKNILVTGGAGYIGSVVIGQLLAKNYNVRVLDKLLFGGESLLGYIDNPGFELIVGDVRNENVVQKALKDIDVVFHLAALVGDPACKINEKVTREINVDATKYLVNVSRSSGVKQFVFLSTCSNYGVTAVDELATEESSLHPLSLYAETKIESEALVLASKESDFRPIVFRFATIFGLSPRMRFNLLVNEFARETALNGSISIRNKKAWRPYLHVLDASSALLTTIEQKVELDGVFNIVGENIQKEQLALMAKEVNPNIRLSIEEGALDDKRDYAVSSEKFRNATGWSSAVSVKDGFVSMVKAVREKVFQDPYEKRYNAWVDDTIKK